MKKSPALPAPWARFDFAGEGFLVETLRIARDQGVAQTGHRLIANAGVHGGQEVPHYHVHILGGANVGPMVSGG